MRFSLGVFEHQWALSLGLILILFVVSLISSYLAYKRLKQHKVRLILVLSANIAAAVAILGLAFNLQLNNASTVTSYLITNGAQAEQLKHIDGSQPIYVLAKPDDSLTEALTQHAFVPLNSVNQLFELQPDIQNLQLIGSGLSKQQWQDLELLYGDKLKAINMTFLPTQPSLGLVEVKWPKESVEGQFIQLSGRLNANVDNPELIYELSLLDPIGEQVQVVRLKAQQAFSFSFAAKSVGQWVYQLQLTQANQTEPIVSEPVAFNVLAAPVLKVLIKQAAPSFETKQFSNWASAFNAKITVLTSISKNKDIRQNFNFTTQELAALKSPLTKQALTNFDLMLIDGRSFMTLSNAQLQDLESAVKSGLGLYILLDQSLIDAWPNSSPSWLSKLTITPLDSATYSAIPQWPNSRIDQSIALVKAQLSVAQDEILVTSHQQQALVTNTKLGLGRVAVSLINSTYGWQTAGLSSEYSHYWQHILYHLSRPQTQPYWLAPSDAQIQFVQQRHQACMAADVRNKTLTHSTNTKKSALFAVPKPMHHEQYCVPIWLTSSGWHQLEMSAENNEHNPVQTSSFYAYQQTDWMAYRHLQNINLTQQKLTQLTDGAEVQPQLKDMPKAWFWWALIIACSFLWIERKTFV
ncbi:hypothetical protein [Paraglaciecola aestuariivivens]